MNRILMSVVQIWDLRAPGCQRDYECTAPVNTVVLHPNQAELISGDQNGNIRVWDLSANACSKELVPDGEIGIKSISISGILQKICCYDVVLFHFASFYFIFHFYCFFFLFIFVVIVHILFKRILFKYK
jgi:WD40 repeat protein